MLTQILAIFSWVVTFAVSTGNGGATAWGVCRVSWEAEGFTHDLLRFSMEVAADAYWPYFQETNGDPIDFTKDVRISGVMKHTKFDYSELKHENVAVFNGVTGGAPTKLGYIFDESSHRGTQDEDSSARHVIAIGFRGSITSNDFWTVGRFLLQEAPSRLCVPNDSYLSRMFRSKPRVHSGFLQTFCSAYEEVVGSLRAMLVGKPVENVQLIITGHSMGGSLALICAYVLSELDDMPKDVKVVTFGSPMTGNAEFFSELESRGIQYIRVQRHSDYLTSLPMMPRYVHGGRLVSMPNIAGAPSVSKIMANHHMGKLVDEWKEIFVDQDNEVFYECDDSGNDEIDDADGGVKRSRSDYADGGVKRSRSGVADEDFVDDLSLSAR